MNDRAVRVSHKKSIGKLMGTDKSNWAFLFRPLPPPAANKLLE